MTTVSMGESLLLRLPDGRIISGYITNTFDFVADTIDPDHFTD
jgi:hypothetical protein